MVLASFFASQRLRVFRRKARQAQANTFVFGRVALYWAVVLARFRKAPRPVYSIASDATRVGGKDMLCPAVYCHSVGMAA